MRERARVQKRGSSAIAIGAALMLVQAGGLLEGASAQAPASGLDRVFHGLRYRVVSVEAPRARRAGTVDGDAQGGERSMPPLRRIQVDELGPYWLTEVSWRDAAEGLEALPSDEPGAVLVASPHDAGTLYHAYVGIHRTDDEGRTWTPIGPRGPSPTFSAVAESPLEPGLLWAGDVEGRVLFSRDGGRVWTDVTPSQAVEEGTDRARGAVTVLEPSPHDGGKAYAAFSPAGGVAPSAPTLLFRTDDHGSTWTSLVQRPVDGEAAIHGRVTGIREDPELAGLLLAGTTDGVFISFDDGATWDSFHLNLPAGAVSELRILGRDLLVAMEGQGVWVMRDVTPLRRVLEGLAAGEPHLFEPAPAYRLDSAPADDLVAGDENPMAGAAIDYLLPSFVRDVRIEVLDATGRLLRAFGSDGRPTDVPAPPEEEPRVDGRRGQRPSGTRAGVHRVMWDLRPVDQSGALGPAVGPGRYEVRMIVDGIRRDRVLEILPDPRPPAP